MKRALVTGATGVVGPALVERLLADGYEVRVLARSHVPHGALPERVTVVRGDITDANAVRRACDGVSHVFHLASKLHINNPGPQLEAEYRQVNVEGTRVVGEQARLAGAERLVYFSTINVYGAAHPGSVLDENVPPAPASMYGRSKLDAERVALSLRRADGRALTAVLRLASVYGPRIKGNYRQMVLALRKGWFVPVGSGRNRRTLVHEQDVAAAAVLAATHPAAGGEVYNVTDGAVHSFDDIVAAICEALGRNPPRVHIPLAPLRLAASFVDAGLRVAGRTAKAEALVMKVVEDMAVSGDRIKSTLGFQPRIDLRTGWQGTVRAILDQTRS